MRRTFRLVVCLLLGCPGAAMAQRFDDIGVRAQGMAGAFVAVADDATATWWNPAGLATGLHVIDLSAELSEGDRWGVAFAFPSLGLSYYRLKISQIQPAWAIGSAGSVRQDNGAAGSGVADVELSQYGATVGQSLGGHLVVATTVKLSNARGESQADLDVGAMAAFGPLRLGVAVRDVRSPTFGSGADAYELERRGRAGASFTAAGHGPLDQVVLAVDADLNSTVVDGRDEQEVAGGVETWWFGRRFGLRGGGGANTSAGGGAFGAFGVSLMPVPRLNVEGAMTRGADSARDRWSLGLRITF